MVKVKSCEPSEVDYCLPQIVLMRKMRVSWMLKATSLDTNFLNPWGSTERHVSLCTISDSDSS
jgi:hypothetical protein